MHRPWASGLALAGILSLVLSACGGGAAPTSVPTAPIPTATKAATPAGTPLVPTPTPQLGQSGVPVAGYPAERVKELLAENYYLGGMKYGAGEEPKYGGSPIFAHRADPTSSDPMVCGSITCFRVNAPMGGIGNLVRPKRSNVFEAEPSLATHWETSGDFTTWTFHLREDVKWHDGVGFTADDVKFWIDLATFPPAGRRAAYAGVFGPLKEVQVVDKYTVRLVEKQPTPHLMETLFATASILSHPKHLTEPRLAAKATVEPADYGWVYLGPYKLDLYQKGSSLSVVRNPTYYEKDEKGRSLPFLDAITFPFITDTTAIVSAFRAGKLDATAAGSGYHLSPSHVMSIKKTLGDKAWFARMPFVAWGPGLNAITAPFNNLNVRQAVQLYTDRQEGIKLVWGGFAVEGGIMVPGSYWANPDILTWPGFNPATKAKDQAEGKRLLEEAGLVGSPVTITCRDNYIPTCEFMDQQLRGLGFASKIQVVDSNLLDSLTSSGRFQISATPGGATLPSRALAGYLTTNPASSIKHGDMKIDEYHTKILETIDPAERRRVLFEAERYIILEKAYYPSWYREEALLGYRTHIRGLWIPGERGDQTIEYATTWVDNSRR